MKNKHAVRGRAAPAEKNGLHPRNMHLGRYDFKRLILASPELAAFVICSPRGDDTVDFSDPAAVRALNRALLADCYGIGAWDIPAQYLCPPIPGRADYLHYAADLLAEGGVIPKGARVRVLDIGTGANCIYPLLGHAIYGWHFVASDIDPVALKNAQRILDANAGYADAIKLRLQCSARSIFDGVVREGEAFDLTMCNPPFHGSLSQAQQGTRRKWKNLGAANKSTLNFGGQGAELWCPGGEEAFVLGMIAQSVGVDCRWFTTLISKSATLPAVYRALKQAGVKESRTIQMSCGQKLSRLVAWRF